MKKQNIISFSLWGDNPKYVDGAFENAKLVDKIYPGWQMRLYCDNTVDIELLKILHTEYNVDVRQVNNNRGSLYGAYWRFFVNDDINVDYYIIRDLDSRLNLREKAAVDEWLSSTKNFHIMRDHPHHTFPIQAGMWGGKANLFSIMELINKHATYNQYGCDQFFLADYIYPMIKLDSVVHDPFFENKPFPKHEQLEDGARFVGQIYINNIPQEA
jgi:hypothetical protein